MLKMLIELDEEKVVRENKYDLDSMKKVINDSCTERGIYMEATGFYVCGTFGKFAGLILGLAKEEWFMEYVSKWLWYNSDESDTQDDFIVEDIKAQFIEN